MDGGFDFQISIAPVQVVEGAAEVTQGTLLPEIQVFHLHLDIEDGVAVQKDFQIKDERFGVNAIIGDGVCDLDGNDFFRGKMQQCADECGQCLGAGLEDDVEHGIVGHFVGEWAGSFLKAGWCREPPHL